jgi:DNA-binding MarR family transcriptional regulator
MFLPKVLLALLAQFGNCCYYLDIDLDQMTGTLRTAAVSGGRGSRERGEDVEPLDLQEFLPYRLAVLADQVSRAIAAIYSEQFDLSRDEWRILAALGLHGEQATRDIGRITTLDKMQVSRAMQRLEARALIRRRTAAEDRRNKRVQLTAAGRSLYAEIVPRVRAREKEILDSLSGADADALTRIMDRLSASVARMQP